MTLTLNANTSIAAKLALWTAENPTATRLMLFALPLALAAASVASAAITHHPLFFLPPTGSGTGGCGGC